MINKSKIKRKFENEGMDVTIKEMISFEEMGVRMVKGWIEFKKKDREVNARDGERVNHPSQPPNCL